MEQKIRKNTAKTISENTESLDIKNIRKEL